VERGTRTDDSLNIGGKLKLLKSTINAKNFIRMLSWSISSDFGTIHSCNVCRSLKSRKFTKIPIFGVQGRSRSSMLVLPASSSALLVMMSGKSMSVRNRSHARQANSGTPTWCLRSRRFSSPSGTKFGDFTLLYGENPESLSHLGLGRYQNVTPRWTDRRTYRITIPSTRQALPAVARKIA